MACAFHDMGINLFEARGLQSLSCMGAIGNLIDRIMLGAVVDFILIHWRDFRWPAFNVADSCITIGAGILLFDGLFRKRIERA